MSGEAGAFGAVVGLGTVLVMCVGAGLYGCPRYSVYSAKMTGEAELAQATQNRQVLVQTAQAERDAEILRAEGTAKANKIIGESLKENAEYLRWLWISKLDNQTNKTVVYVPTDGMVPQLETGRIGEAK
ncbi:membrane protease subunit [Komagataeibacter xylinus]|uniref:Membrane protease subunit n=1 Tax=Komagataeibacter xylinus TaxID=28448 RepID=A0A857FQB7_KOMXY|nr:membrane protease subunit [Komagataeibacter xylinus]QHC35390.1 membrane protease subunit [Komagataeibacter xylinus]